MVLNVHMQFLACLKAAGFNTSWLMKRQKQKLYQQTNAELS